MDIANKVLQLKNDFDNVYKVGEGKGFENGYDSGYYKGEKDGYAKGFEAGSDDVYEAAYNEGYQAQHDYFWDKLQRNGNLGNYAYAFAGNWIPSMFYPKYNITPTRADRMFETFDNNYNMNEPILNLVERLNECRVELNTSKATNINSMFSYAKISRIGVIDTTSATALSQTFANARSTTTIDKLILKSDGSQTFSSTFTNCEGLKHIVIEGAIGTNIDFQHSPLTTESIVSIIEHLSDSKKATLTLKASAKESMEFPYTSLQTNTTYNSWDELVATKSAWTISLIQEG